MSEHKNVYTVDECRQGQHHHHHHHHVGLAEGMAPEYASKLRFVLFLAIFYFVAQAVGSYYSGSLALLADAGHKLADIGAIALAVFAAWFSRLSSSPQKTFGYFRLEILAALVNGLSLFLMALFILWEAYQRQLGHGHAEIEGGAMLAVAGLGLVINLAAAAVLYPVREFNLNVKGALLHIVADLLNSAGTMLAALGILLFHLTWLDTAVSVLIALLVLWNASRIFAEAFNILMESAPRRLSPETVRDYIMRHDGVTDVHDLHIWTITTGRDALLAHVTVTQDAFSHQTVCGLERDLRETFDLCHITVQLEPPGFEEDEILF